MIIFNNDKELKSPYTKRETRIVEINSVLSLQEIYSLLQKGEPLPEGKVNINVCKFADGSLEFPSNDIVAEESGKTSDYLYTKRLNNDNVDYYYETTYQRPNEFIQYEKFQFHQPITLQFTQDEITNEELLKEIKTALNCPPTLMNQDLPVEDLSKYANAAQDLICPTLPIGKGNISPTIQELDHYLSMTDYEKRLIRTNYIHPYKAFKIAELLKSRDGISPNFVFSQKVYNNIQKLKTPEENLDILKERLQIPFTEDDKKIIEDAFKAVREHNGFVPRVANEYIYGCCLRYGINTSSITFDKIYPYAEKFNRESVSKVANTRSPILLGLSVDYNFNQFPERLKEVLASYIDESDFRQLERKGFFQWLSLHKDISANDLIRILEDSERIPNHVNENMTIVSFISAIKNARGIEECQKFEQDDYFNYNDGTHFQFSNNVLAIRGRHTVAKQGNITMRMLQADDYGHFTAGIDTTCCQRYDNAGESCVYKAVTDPFASTVVIEEGDKVKAQGFVWTDELTDTLVFDNIEFCGNDSLDSMLSAKYLNIIQEWANAMPYKNIHIGVGYNASMKGWGKKIDYQATLPTTLYNKKYDRCYGFSGSCYSDYHSDARSIKKDGTMLLQRNNTVAISIETAPDEPTKFDELASPTFNFMLNACEKSIDERLEFAKQFIENPSVANQIAVIRLNPKAVASLETVDREVQLFVLEHYPQVCSLIKNPIPEIEFKNISDNPFLIKDIPEDKLTVDLVKLAVEKNGRVLEYVPDSFKTVEICSLAIKTSPESIRFANEITPEMQIEIASIEPKYLIGLHNLCNEAILKAMEKEPYLVTVLPNVTHEAKLLAVSKVPDLVLDIKNPILEGETAETHNAKIKALWKTAVENNPYLIRNCGRSFPEFRLPAIEKNPYIVTILPDSNKEEITKAVSLNPNVWYMIKHPERKQFAYQKVCEIYGPANVPKKPGPHIQTQREHEMA